MTKGMRKDPYVSIAFVFRVGEVFSTARLRGSVGILGFTREYPELGTLVLRLMFYQRARYIQYVYYSRVVPVPVQDINT
jgi:hypothetical protein